LKLLSYSQFQSTIQLILKLNISVLLIYVHGRKSWKVGGLDPLKIFKRVRICFDTQNVTFVHSKLLLDNSASFTSSTTKDFCQKWRINLKQFDGLTMADPEPSLFSDRSTPPSRARR